MLGERTFPALYRYVYFLSGSCFGHGFVLMCWPVNTRRVVEKAIEKITWNTRNIAQQVVIHNAKVMEGAARDNTCVCM